MQYLIIGKGKEEKRLKTLVKRLDLENHVSFLGFVSEEELVMFYNASDVFILVSREIPGDFEGFGLVYLEANACGKPVIGAKTGGIEDAIKHGETGLLVRDVKMDNVAEAILKLLINKDYAVKLGKTGLAQIKKYRTWEFVADEMLRFIIKRDQ